MYVKLRGAKKDDDVTLPHQGRWRRIGTAIGDVIQRDILFAERHYERLTGDKLRFRFERTPDGRPMFEEFAKKLHVIEHAGKRFAIYGTCDGILHYTTDGGEIIRVGLEIKSKQTTHSQTSDYALRNPKEDHERQVIAYSIMYGVDLYVILYVNASKKAWAMTDEEYRKNRDIKAFGVVITDDDRRELLDLFAEVVDAVEREAPPPLELDKWVFNNYKRACVESLTDAEVAEIEAQVKRVMKSRLPDWKKQPYYDAWNFIKAVRGIGI